MDTYFINKFLYQALTEKGKSVEGVGQWPYRAVAQALEIIPATLAQNCGANTIRTLTTLRAKHATGKCLQSLLFDCKYTNIILF